MCYRSVCHGYHQVIIFVKSISRCMALSQLLVEQNFPAIAIHKAMTQDERLVTCFILAPRLGFSFSWMFYVLTVYWVSVFVYYWCSGAACLSWYQNVSAGCHCVRWRKCGIGRCVLRNGTSVVNGSELVNLRNFFTMSYCFCIFYTRFLLSICFSVAILAAVVCEFGARVWNLCVFCMFTMWCYA